MDGVLTSYLGKVGLALSGGGFRASLYHIGVLAKLDVLRHVEVMSCVSGGSILGAYYYLELRRLLQTKADEEITREDYIQCVRRVEEGFLRGVQTNVRTRVAAGIWTNLRMVPEAWLPLQWGREVFGQNMFTTRLSSQFEGLARLKPGVTREQAEWELRAISKEIDAEVPRTPPRSARLLPMRQHFLGGIQRPMIAIFAGSALVLIMCCVNVGALVLLRGRNRQRELAVRAAMGGGRARLAQLLLTETMVLVTAGAVVGIGLGHWGVELFRAAYGDRITSFAPMAMDIPTLLASGVLMVVVGMACGLYPALRGSRLDPGAVLRNATVGRGSRNRGGGRGELPLIVVVEAAVTIVLLIGAALTVQSLRRLVNTDLGYDATDLMTMRIDLTASRYADVADRGRFARLFIDRVQGSPGTEAVGLIGPSMLGSAAWHFYMTAPKDDPTRVENQAAVQWLSVTPGAIDAMGVTLLRGRDVSWDDRADAPGVALISSRVAERLWPGEDAIGKPYYLYGDPRRAGTVVGVVGEAKHRGRFSRTAMVGDAYIPFAQKPTLQVRSCCGRRRGVRVE